MACGQKASGRNLQVKAKERVRNFAEVFTAQREVNSMCDLIPMDVYSSLESTFLEPACGEGVFLLEIFRRKLSHCKTIQDGLTALQSLYGVDIQADNVAITKGKLVDTLREHFGGISEEDEKTAREILETHIICDNTLNPQTEIVKSWGITPCEDYIKFLKKREKRERERAMFNVHSD